MSLHEPVKVNWFYDDRKWQRMGEAFTHVDNLVMNNTVFNVR